MAAIGSACPVGVGGNIWRVDYLVIARKYRPQTFSEVAGQDVISRTLTNAIRAGRLAHGFIFTGPSGVGKTTMARILAKALCCERGVTAEPCGSCEQCRMIAGSHHPDVFEIDAATHNGVDDIRDLSERASYAPTQARFRIYILDEVHMLSTAAWNALLKLVEEPPSHLYFIFATTEVEKVPATVVNRCQRFDFRSIDLDTIVGRLAEVAAGEGCDIADRLLYRLARAAGGGMRDAQTLLDQLIAMSGGTVSETDLDLLLGAARGEDVAEVLEHLISGRGDAALERLDALLAEGVAPATFLEQLLERLRLLLLIDTCGLDSPPVRRTGLAAESDRELAKKIGSDKLLRICQIVLGSQQRLRQGVDARLQVELACVRIAQLGEVLDVEGLLRRLEKLERQSISAGGALPGPR